MNSKKNFLSTYSRSEKVVFLMSCVCIVSIIAVDRLVLHKYLLKEGRPKSSVGYIIKSILIFISVIGLCWSCVGSRRPKLLLAGKLFPDWVSILLTLLLAVITLYLFIFQPLTFDELSLEDNLVESSSAWLLFGSFLITGLCALRNIHVLKNSKLILVSLGLLSLGFFVMGMEEVSWFQRVLEIKTPDSFNTNIQQEMNLHNFATSYIENIYYFGTFVFLVVLPFIRFLYPSISNNIFLKTFVARPFIALIGSIACAYNFDMWNVIFIQIAFFASLTIVFTYAIFSSIKREKYFIIFTLVLLVASQMLFLFDGANFGRIWDITEYKEFFISFVLFIYSCDVVMQIRPSFLSNTISEKTHPVNNSFGEPLAK